MIRPMIYYLFRRDDPKRIPVLIQHPDGSVNDRLIPGEPCRPLLDSLGPRPFSICAVDPETQETLFILEIRAPLAMPGGSLIVTLPPPLYGKV